MRRVPGWRRRSSSPRNPAAIARVPSPHAIEAEGPSAPPSTPGQAPSNTIPVVAAPPEMPPPGLEQPSIPPSSPLTRPTGGQKAASSLEVASTISRNSRSRWDSGPFCQLSAPPSVHPTGSGSSPSSERFSLSTKALPCYSLHGA